MRVGSFDCVCVYVVLGCVYVCVYVCAHVSSRECERERVCDLVGQRKEEIETWSVFSCV